MKKLILNKKTISNLNGKEMNDVNGGNGTVDTTKSFIILCTDSIPLTITCVEE